MADQSPKEGSEFDIIKRYFMPLAAGDQAALGLLDDAAVLDVPQGYKLVVTTDALVAGVHFLEKLSPQDIAHKVVGVNLSDLAAMGASPRAVFLAAQFPKNTPESWIAAFAQGFGAALSGSGATLLGGDTVTTPGPMAFTLTALGFAAVRKVLTRSGAKAGDDLYVTGTIGDGALGLLCLTGKLPADVGGSFCGRTFDKIVKVVIGVLSVFFSGDGIWIIGLRGVIGFVTIAPIAISHVVNNKAGGIF